MFICDRSVMKPQRCFLACSRLFTVIAIYALYELHLLAYLITSRVYRCHTVGRVVWEEDMRVYMGAL